MMRDLHAIAEAVRPELEVLERALQDHLAERTRAWKAIGKVAGGRPRDRNTDRLLRLGSSYLGRFAGPRPRGRRGDGAPRGTA